MTGIMQQRIREAVKAELAGHAVRFTVEAGGAGRQFVAMYRVQDYTRESRHVIFTGGPEHGFQAIAEECRQAFAAQVESATVGLVV